MTHTRTDRKIVFDTEVLLQDFLNTLDNLFIEHFLKSNEACLSGYHPHPLYVVCTHFPE